jgi:hypothetical protein
MLQFEAGSTPSSYIPNAGATSGVTRAAETLTVPAANLPWPSPVVIGEELVTGDSSTFTSSLGDWTYYTGATATATGGVFSISGIGTYQIAGLLTGGKLYLVEFDYTRAVSSYVPYVGDRLGPSNQVRVPNDGTLSGRASGVIFAGTGTGAIGSASGAVTIDNISVREINPLSVSIQMQGRMTYADNEELFEVEQIKWGPTGSAIRHFVRTSSTDTLRFEQSVGAVYDTITATPPAAGVLTPFNIAARHGSTFINGAINGVARNEDTTPVALPDLSATDLVLGYDYMGTIKLFRMWADDLADAGIEEATLPSLEPSLSLTFDGSETSFTVSDWSE